MNNQLFADPHRTSGFELMAGMGDATRDVFQWFDVQLTTGDVIDNACRAGRLITIDIPEAR